LVGADMHPGVSDDGSVVVFGSPRALTPQAVEAEGLNVDGETVAVENVYEYRAGRVYLISDGQTTTVATVPNAPGSRLLGVSSSGDDVFFYTPGHLVPQADDEQTELYDARVGGGFPGLPMAASCLGDGCQGAGASGLAPVGAGSAASGGEGAPAEARAGPGRVSPEDQPA
jgi:hypothetical protein